MSAPVPAWKRLGLKLKNTQQQAGHPQPTENGDASMTNDGLASERPAKRQRRELNDSVKLAKPTLNGNQKHINHGMKEKAHSSGSQATEADEPGIKRKKSVTFTNDTKIEDGDSRTTIDFPAGSPGSTPRKEAKQVIPDEVPSSSPTTSIPTRNKVKKPKVERQASRAQVKDKSEPSLAYLAQHRTERSSWKFNKNRDVWILSNVLKEDLIPSNHLLAMAGYVEGLPHNSGARKRLVEECQGALKDEATATDEVKQDFKNAISRSGDMSATGDTSWESVPRAQLMLWALGEEVSQPTPATPVQSKRSRKSRTAAPIDLSSSESDSDSDSGSDSSDGGTSLTKAAKSNNTAEDEDTSSSGSSSGTSDSENDSESESSTESSSSSDSS